MIADRHSSAHAGPRRRVLVVDDDRDFAESLRNFLVLKDYEVEMAFDAGQAQQAVEHFDAQVAILDYRLGHSVGVDLVTPLKRRRPGMICILATAYGDMDAVIKALRGGIYDYFGKPMHTDELLVTLDRCFENLKLRQEKEAAEGALREARKNEAVAQVAGGVSHHFNNLLAIMLGNLERLQLRLSDDPDQARFADNLMRAIDRATDINHNLAAFTRQQFLRPETIDLHALLSGMEDEFQRVLGGSIYVRLMPSPGLWRVRVDRRQLAAALLSLAHNAREAMTAGGSFVIAGANVEMLDSDSARVPGLPVGRYVALAVTDTGKGMPPEIAERAFEPFFSQKGLAEKVGLGLSTVYGFVKQSGGNAIVESEEGQGTTVRLYLPRAQSSAHGNWQANGDLVISDRQ